MASWQKIYSSTNLHQASIVKGVLESKGIAAVLVDKQDRSYLIGHVEVKVQPGSVIQSLRIIEEEIKFDHE